eukprot:sb/3467356/
MTMDSYGVDWTRYNQPYPVLLVACQEGGYKRPGTNRLLVSALDLLLSDWLFTCFGRLPQRSRIKSLIHACITAIYWLDLRIRRSDQGFPLSLIKWRIGSTSGWGIVIRRRLVRRICPWRRLIGRICPWGRYWVTAITIRVCIHVITRCRMIRVHFLPVFHLNIFRRSWIHHHDMIVGFVHFIALFAAADNYNKGKYSTTYTPNNDGSQKSLPPEVDVLVEVVLRRVVVVVLRRVVVVVVLRLDAADRHTRRIRRRSSVRFMLTNRLSDRVVVNLLALSLLPWNRPKQVNNQSELVMQVT